MRREHVRTDTVYATPRGMPVRVIDPDNLWWRDPDERAMRIHPNVTRIGRSRSFNGDFGAGLLALKVAYPEGGNFDEVAEAMENYKLPVIDRWRHADAHHAADQLAAQLRAQEPRLILGIADTRPITQTWTEYQLAQIAKAEDEALRARVWTQIQQAQAARWFPAKAALTRLGIDLDDLAYTFLAGTEDRPDPSIEAVTAVTIPLPVLVTILEAAGGEE